jgi:hypothetical protein
MDEAALLTDAFGRVREIVHRVVDGLDEDQLGHRVGGANSIAWLVWHLARVQDDHLADAAGHEQVWLEQGWSGRFDLPFEPDATGYGHDAEEVSAVRAGAELLSGYADAVYERTVAYVSGLSGTDLDRVVDEAWDPPVTLGVRLVSVIADDLQHAGQAAYARGLLDL